MINMYRLEYNPVCCAWIYASSASTPLLAWYVCVCVRACVCDCARVCTCACMCTLVYMCVIYLEEYTHAYLSMSVLFILWFVALSKINLSSTSMMVEAAKNRQ